MIRVIIERHAKNPLRLLPLFRDIRAEAMKQPGYISGENLVDTEDHSNIIVISTWQSLKDWKTWYGSEARTRLDQRIQPLLAEPARIKTYRYLSYQRANES